LPRDEIKRRVRAEIAALASRGSIAIRPRGEITWPTATERLDLFGVAAAPEAPMLRGFAAGEVVDVVALFAAVHQDALTRAAEREADCLDDAGSLSDEACGEREATMLVQLLEAERADESVRAGRRTSA
jgi:hypothetical protein